MDTDSDVFVCIWLLSQDKYLADEEKLLIEKLKENFPSIKIFDDPDECCNYILTLDNTLVFLRLGQKRSYIVKLFKELDQIKCIYLSEKLEHKCNSKVRGVFTDIEELDKQLSTDIRIFENDMTCLPTSQHRSIRLETSTTNVEQEGKYLSWFQILLQILILMPSKRNHVYENLFKEARRLNPSQATNQRIKEFQEKYEPENALHWFTKDSFIYRIINQALRTQSIVIIFKFRSIIADLYNHLKILKENQQNSFQREPLYRGQRIASTEFERLKGNLHGPVSLNTFTSTSTDRQAAMMYLNKQEEDENFKSILFQYEFDPLISLTDLPPFANISQISSMPDEREVLLSPGMTALIQKYSIDEEYPRIHIFHLQIQASEDSFLKQLPVDFWELLKQQNAEETSYIMHLCTILSMLGQHDKIYQIIRSVPTTSNKVFELFRSSLTLWNAEEHSSDNNHSDFISSLASRFKSFYEQVFAENQQIDQISPLIRTFFESHMNIINSLSTNKPNGFEIYAYHDKLTELLKQTFLSLRAVTSSDTRPFYCPTMENVLISRSSLGRDQTTWNELPPINSETIFGKDFSSTVFNLFTEALRANQSGDVDKAILLCKEALEVSKSLHDDDEQRATILNYLAHLYQQQKNYLEMLPCCIEVLRSSNLPPNSLKFITALYQAGNCLSLIELYEDALGSFRYALDLFDKHHSENNSSMRNKLKTAVECVELILFCKANHIRLPDFNLEQ